MQMCLSFKQLLHRPELKSEINAHDLFFASEPKQGSSKYKIWCIQQSKELFVIDVCNNILFIHAILGCDTTYRLSGLGKGLALKKFKSNVLFRQQADVFSSSWPVVKNDIVVAGENALVCLYGGASDKGLNILRYKSFCEKVAKSTSHLEPQTLLPNAAAAEYHNLRVYCQIMDWKGMARDMKPEEWGWHNDNQKFIPIQMDQPAAPSKLLDVICCSCKKDCSSRRCTCRKSGLPCTAVCN